MLALAGIFFFVGVYIMAYAAGQKAAVEPRCKVGLPPPTLVPESNARYAQWDQLSSKDAAAIKRAREITEACMRLHAALATLIGVDFGTRLAAAPPLVRAAMCVFYVHKLLGAPLTAVEALQAAMALHYLENGLDSKVRDELLDNYSSYFDYKLPMRVAPFVQQAPLSLVVSLTAQQVH